MSQSPPVLESVNLVASDMEATLTFYRRLGLEIADDVIWRTETGPHHVDLSMPNGVNLAFDSPALAGYYNAGFRSTKGTRSVLGFKLASRELVDERYKELVDAGSPGLQAPFDAFWGARYAVVADPDGNHVGLMSAAEDAFRSAPPGI